MARNKAIFDADILINIYRTGSLDYIIELFEEIYVSDYVYERELDKFPMIKNIIKKLVNKNKAKILYYNDLTQVQKKFYRTAKNILDNQTTDDYVDEGEKITACFANAHKVYYYMSDDNKAAPYIRTLTGVEVINYCDILYISSRVNQDDIGKVNQFYQEYIGLFEEGYIPGIFKNESGETMDFRLVMAMCFDKFNKSEKLSKYLDLFLDS
ncbi:PIN domain-containing protein [Natronospora cellulosivora (SeqCode)]